MPERRDFFLLCRVRDLLCALPIEHVEEAMRPLAVDAIAGVPSFVRGLAVVRGVPIPVVDVASLVSGTASEPTRPPQESISPRPRFVSVKMGSRRVVLAVDAVVAVVEIPSASLEPVPLLFHDACLDVISAIGRMDADLLLVLRSAHLMSEEHWSVLEAGCARA